MTGSDCLFDIPVGFYVLTELPQRRVIVFRGTWSLLWWSYGFILFYRLPTLIIGGYKIIKHRGGK